MKKVLDSFLLGAFFLTGSLNAGAVIVSAGTIAIPLQKIISETHQDILSRAPGYVSGEVVRGGSTTVALLLNGLAQTCFHVGQAASTATPNPLVTQGILNTIGASLATAAAIVLDRKQQREQKKADHANLSKALSYLVEQLENEEHTTTTRMPKTDLFSVLKALELPESKEAFIQLLLSDDKLSEEFLNDVLEVAVTYCQEHEEALVQVIRIRAAVVFIDWLVKQRATKEDSQLPCTSLNTDNSVLYAPASVSFYAPSADGKELPLLIEQIASRVADKLVAMYAMMRV